MTYFINNIFKGFIVSSLISISNPACTSNNIGFEVDVPHPVKLVQLIKETGDSIKKSNCTSTLDLGEFMPHMVAMGVLKKCYEGMEPDSFNKYIETVAKQYSESFKLKFPSYYPYIDLSPLMCLFQTGPFDEWSKEQQSQAFMVFNAFKEYEPLFPDKFVNKAQSILHLILRSGKPCYAELTSVVVPPLIRGFQVGYTKAKCP